MLFMLLALLSCADVVVMPEANAAEPSCDPVSQAKEGLECARCTVYRESRRQCEQLEVQGYSTVCTVPGSKISTEVLCRTERPDPVEPSQEAAESQAVPEVETSTGESSADSSSQDRAFKWGCAQLAPAASLPFLLLAVVPLRRRRRD